MKILGIPGSLRRASYNAALVRAAAEVAPGEITVEPFHLGGIPLFDADVEASGVPDAVGALKDAIAGADAVLFSTPEYNYSMPGVLKNAFDWASRPRKESPLYRKPVAVIGASPGPYGTARAQLALRQSLLFTESFVLPAPQLLVARAGAVFSDGRLVDEDLRQRLRSVLEALSDWTRRLG